MDMRTQEGFEIKAGYVPSSVEDFCSLRVELVGQFQMSVFPINSDEARHLAAELIACADKIDAARLDAIRSRDIAFESAMAADERAAA